MNEPAFLSAIEQVAAIKSGRMSSAELLELFLERVNRFNPGLNAIVQTQVEPARERARAADAALSRGEWWGPLHGLPVTIKDTLEVAGMPCASGAPMLKNHVPVKNADVVQSFVDAGAIVFGKTNVPMFGGDFQSFNDVYGQSNNPWNTDLTPGGSSGGAAAALAAGLCGLEIGSDIGGSIRTPAHFCGIYGHKPSFGIVPQRGHIPPPPGIFTGDYSLGIDIMVIGPLARSIDDIELAMELMVAPEKPERRAWKIDLPAPRKQSLNDFRIGVWLDDPACPVDRRVGDRLQEAVDALSKKGAVILEKHPDVDFGFSHDVFLSLLAAVMGSGTPDKYFKKWVEEARELAAEDQSYMARHIRGATQRHKGWVERDAFRQILRQKWADFFVDFDVLLCPAASVPAFPHDHRYLYDRTITVNGAERPYMDIIGWAGLAGLTGLPATIAPAGRTPEGLPVGIQIIGPYLEDRTPIHFAKLIAGVIGGFTPPDAFQGKKVHG